MDTFLLQVLYVVLQLHALCIRNICTSPEVPEAAHMEAPPSSLQAVQHKQALQPDIIFHV